MLSIVVHFRIYPWPLTYACSGHCAIRGGLSWRSSIASFQCFALSEACCIQATHLINVNHQILNVSLLVVVSLNVKLFLKFLIECHAANIVLVCSKRKDTLGFIAARLRPSLAVENWCNFWLRSLRHIHVDDPYVVVLLPDWLLPRT